MYFRLNSLKDIEKPSFSPLPVVTAGRSVPKIIHQTSYAPPWHPKIEENVRFLKQNNPGWDYRFYDDDAIIRFIGEQYGQSILDLYRRLGPDYGAARADLFRYLVIYKEGGVYLDMKSSATRPLDEVIAPDDTFLLSRWQNEPGGIYEGWGSHSEVSHLGGEFQQWFIAAVPGHPFLRRVIELVIANLGRYVQGLHGTGAYAVLRVTGPVPYTIAISSLMGTCDHRLVDSIADLGLVYSVFDAGNARSHEAILPHYSKLSTPLVKMSGLNAGVSKVATTAKTMLRKVRA